MFSSKPVGEKTQIIVFPQSLSCGNQIGPVHNSLIKFKSQNYLHGTAFDPNFYQKDILMKIKP